MKLSEKAREWVLSCSAWERSDAPTDPAVVQQAFIDTMAWGLTEGLRAAQRLCGTTTEAQKAKAGEWCNCTCHYQITTKIEGLIQDVFDWPEGKE